MKWKKSSAKLIPPLGHIQQAPPPHDTGTVHDIARYPGRGDKSYLGTDARQEWECNGKARSLKTQNIATAVGAKNILTMSRR